MNSGAGGRPVTQTFMLYNATCCCGGQQTHTLGLCTSALPLFPSSTAGFSSLLSVILSLGMGLHSPVQRQVNILPKNLISTMQSCSSQGNHQLLYSRKSLSTQCSPTSFLFLQIHFLFSKKKKREKQFLLFRAIKCISTWGGK